MWNGGTDRLTIADNVGGGQANSIVVGVSGGNVTVSDGGSGVTIRDGSNNPVTVAASSVVEILVNANDGNDSVDLSVVTTGNGFSGLG